MKSQLIVFYGYYFHMGGLDNPTISIGTSENPLTFGVKKSVLSTLDFNILYRNIWVGVEVSEDFAINLNILPIASNIFKDNPHLTPARIFHTKPLEGNRFCD